MTKFVGLKAKTYIYLINNGSEGKKAKSTKKCVVKKNLNYKSCLEAMQLKDNINYLEKNEINIGSFEKITINNKSILKTHQRFKSERHNVFVKEIDKIVFC